VGQQRNNTYEHPPPQKKLQTTKWNIECHTPNFDREGGTFKPAGAVGKDSPHYFEEHE
jgi:hypothetical protein